MAQHKLLKRGQTKAITSTGEGVVSRRYHLRAREAVTRLAALPPTRTPAPPLEGFIVGSHAHEELVKERIRERLREKQSARRTPRPAHSLLSVNAPRPARQNSDRVNVLVSDDRWLEDVFGRIRLVHGRDSINLQRLSSGVMSFLLDHNSERPIGRVLRLYLDDSALRGKVELGSSPRARSAYAEIVEGVRSGVSPAFAVHKARFLRQDEQGYDRERIDTVVQVWEPYEISSVVAPRNPGAKVTQVGRYSMNMGAMPNIADTSDLTNLSLVCGRVALQGNTGSPSQRARLEKCYEAFDAAEALGTPRDKAIESAKAAAWIP